MQRGSRAESQSRTRAAILASAHKLFVRNGFRATSLEQIATEAGYTQGAVYSNFKNKTEIGIAVIDQLYDDEERRLLDLLAKAAMLGKPWHTAIAEWTTTGSIGDVSWARLESEVAVFAADDERTQHSTGERYARIRQRWARLFAATIDASGVDIPIDAEVLATALVGLALGVGMQRAADPAVSATVVADLVRTLAETYGLA